MSAPAFERYVRGQLDFIAELRRSEATYGDMIRQFSDACGRPVNGSEKVLDLIAEIDRKRQADPPRSAMDAGAQAQRPHRPRRKRTSVR